jgi:MFS family permease
MVLPVLPLFLSAQGYNEAFIGVVIAAYNVSSFSARPVFGRLVDIGRPRSALIASCGLLGVTAFGYLVPSTAFLFVVRAAHGLGWAGLNAVGTAWIAALAPVTRRAEAMGYYTMSQSFGTAVAPAIGIGLLASYGAGAAFSASAVCGIAAFVAALMTQAPPRVTAHVTNVTPGVTEVTHVTPGVTPEVTNVTPHVTPEPRFWLARFVEPSVISVTAILTLVQINGPVISSFAPLYFRSMGVSGIEWYFAGQGVMSIFSRALLGTWADRIGRARSLLLGFGIQIGGLIMLWLSADLILLTIGGALYTLGQGVSQPSLYAMAADRADPARRGSAMATYTMGFQLGSGVGAVVWGSTIEHFGYHVMYACTLLPMLAAIGMAAREGTKRPAALGSRG